jgi:hypothetical protein
MDPLVLVTCVVLPPAFMYSVVLYLYWSFANAEKKIMAASQKKSEDGSYEDLRSLDRIRGWKTFIRYLTICITFAFFMYFSAIYIMIRHA